MSRRRNSSQKKEQEKVTARALIQTDISNIPDPEFKTTIIKIQSGLEKSIEDTRESLTTEIKDLKTTQAEMKKKCNNQNSKPTGCNDRDKKQMKE